MRRPETVPRWLIAATLIALGANMLASAMNEVTIGLMRSLTPFAIAVGEYDLKILPYYKAIVYPAALLAMVRYVWPIIRHFRCDPDQPATNVVQRRTVNGPLAVACLGLLAWLLAAVTFPVLTLVHFGRWSPELSSQQVVSPLVNGFLAATSTYLLLDWLFRAMVVPRVFPGGRLAEVSGSLTLGVRARLLIFLLAVAFTPLFTVLGLIRAAAARVATGTSFAEVLPALTHASGITFAVYIGLGIAFTLLLSRTFTQPLAAAAAAVRRIQAGDLATRVQPTSSDEIGVLEDGVNAMAATLQDKERILRTFGRIVEPAVRDHLLSGELHLGGEVRMATILFCDLRGFTAIAEQMAPGAVVATLNQYFSAMAVWVRTCGGFVDKFVGDAMLVVFGLFDTPAAPQTAGESGAHGRAAAAAVRCALGMQERLLSLNEQRRRDGLWPLAISVGVDSGEVVAGTIGAEDRLEYTVIGDAVNVANRLQELCRDRGCGVLVSEATYTLAREVGETPVMAALERLPLRGRRGVVQVFTTAA